jgi:excisionase family DNA binding protein
VSSDIRKEMPMRDVARESPLLHDIPGVERLTGLSRATIYRLIAERRLRPVHIGRAVRIPAAELRRFVAELEAASGLAPVA